MSSELELGFDALERELVRTQADLDALRKAARALNDFLWKAVRAGELEMKGTDLGAAGLQDRLNALLDELRKTPDVTQDTRR